MPTERIDQPEVSKQREELIATYDRDLQHYRFHLEWLLKIDAFVITVTGAVSSYCLANAAHRQLMWAMVFPFIVSLGLALVGYRCLPLTKNTQENIKELTDRLGYTYFQETAALPLLLKSSIYLCLLLAIASVVFFFLF